MEKQDLSILSKEELMERITKRCAKELNGYKHGGGLFLIFFVFMVAYMLWYHDATAWEYSLVFLAFMIECFIVGWWMSKITKCDDAKTLVDTYEKHLKFEKVHFIVAAVVAVLIACLIFTGTLPLTVKSPLFFGILVFCIPLGNLGALNRRNSAIAQDVDRLRKLIGNWSIINSY